MILGGLQQRDLDRLPLVRLADFPAADIVALDFFQQELGRQGHVEPLALAAAKLQVQPPRQPQAVLLHVEHGGRRGREAAVHLALGHLGPPPDAHRAVGARGGADDFVRLFGLVAAAIRQLSEAHFGLRLGHGDRQCRGRGRRHDALGHVPTALVRELQPHGQFQLVPALARDVEYRLRSAQAACWRVKESFLMPATLSRAGLPSSSAWANTPPPSPSGTCTKPSPKTSISIRPANNRYSPSPAPSGKPPRPARTARAGISSRSSCPGAPGSTTPRTFHRAPATCRRP